MMASLKEEKSLDEIKQMLNKLEGMKYTDFFEYRVLVSRLKKMMQAEKSHDIKMKMKCQDQCYSFSQAEGCFLGVI